MAITINGTGDGKINNTSFSTTTGNVITTGDSGTITEGMLDSNYYEEGTWTPALSGLSPTFSSQVGYYVKIGKMVYAYFHMTTSAMTMTGDYSGFQVNGLPFSSPSTSGDNNDNGAVIGSYDPKSSSMLDGKHASVAGFQIYNTTVHFLSTSGTDAGIRYAEINQNGVKTLRGSFVYYTSA